MAEVIDSGMTGSVRVTRVIVDGQACHGGEVAEQKRKQISRPVALVYLGSCNPTYQKWKALPDGAELNYGIRTYTEGGEEMEEKHLLLASLVGRKKANVSRLLRRKEKRGERGRQPPRKEE